MKKLVVACVFCLGLFVIVGRIAPAFVLTMGFVPLAIGLLVVGLVVAKWVK